MTAQYGISPEDGQRIPLTDLLNQIRGCNLCAQHLPLGPNPVIRVSADSPILIIGQAPGTRVHQTGIPWNDPSGDRLRQWLNVDPATFYNTHNFSIMPMGLCYPGKGKSGDLPPRKECAPQWHDRVWSELINVKLVLLIGQYAQKAYLDDEFRTLTERVKNFRSLPEPFFALPHPSPRNQLWLKKNAWFEQTVIPELQRRTRKLIDIP